MTLDTHPMSDMDVERRLGGAGPFVINLHASTAPISLPIRGPAGNEYARLYQIQRVDGGRIRYRLRLGPFATEDQAEAVLVQARLEYPGALLVAAAADDLHAIALVHGKASPAGSPADTQAPEVVPQTARAPASAVAAPFVTATAPAAAATAPVVAAPAPVVAALVPAVAARAPVTIASAPEVVAPALVVAAAAPPRAAVSVASDSASMQALLAALDTESATAAPKSVTLKPPVLYTVPAAKVAARDVARAGTTVTSLESTQTQRPLTPLELGEREAPRWFVVQLGLSGDAFDPDVLPHLDIFSLYRLYTVVGLDQGRLVHALRLGFFGEEAAARAVANYLAGFYDEPTVKRVSVAERDRFADQRVEARKDVGATGRHLTIEITDELVVRGQRSSR